MKVLFLAPLPPPITGHSAAAKVVLDALTSTHDVTVVDLGRGSQHDGGVTWGRVREVALALSEVRAGQRQAAAIYLTISESLFGNLKDLFIYALCAPRLDRLVVHLHGGSIGRELFEVKPVIKWLNARALSRVRGVILSGASHLPIVGGMTPPERVHLIPNFADDSLFLDPSMVAAKFADRATLRVLYMSGMSPMKGYDVLASAYLALPSAMRQRMQIDFAGKFESAKLQQHFEAKIAAIPGLVYHGLVDAATKAALFAQAHVFCLPTAFREGQPLSILEAYASGCVVVTTGQAGILDIFTPGVNGWVIEPESVQSTGDALKAVLAAEDALLPIALRSRENADLRFRTQRFTDAVLAVLSTRGA
jgi:glycosyltransferase involved in cell wall biosynthesis